MAGETTPVPAQQSAFGEKYTIKMTEPLPQFDSSGGKAYMVVDSRSPDMPLYAFIHEPGFPIRHSAYTSLHKKPVPNVVCPVDRGIMKLDLDRPSQRLVTIFERPLGEALFTADGKSDRLDVSKLRTNVALSIIKGIAGLHKNGIIHGSINPRRMFFVSEESDDVYLGECITTSPGFDQPHEMEPLEIAFADKEGRGTGSEARDFFQFGASIMGLYFGRDLSTGLDKNQMLMARVNQSSFWALSGGQDIPGAIGQLLKGVMMDEYQDRWGFEDVLTWYEGTVPIKRSGIRSWTMNRPTNFKGTSFVDRRLLATAFSMDPKSASVVIRALDFEEWMHTHMRDEIYSETIHSALALSAGSGMGHEEGHTLVARFSMFLHPTGPIRYKGMTINLDGLADMIAILMYRDEREKLRHISEILNKKFMNDQYKLTQDQNMEGARFLKDYGGYETYIRSTDPGKGIERVFYDMNPGMPCLSTKFDRLWTLSVKQLVININRLAKSGSIKNILLDRHIAAFILSHDPQLEREYNKLIAAKNDPTKFSTLSADFFALLQRQFKIEALPALSNKLVDSMVNAIKGLKNKKTQETVANLFEKIRSTGDIEKLMKTVNLSQIIVDDARKFSAARSQIRKLERERQKIPPKVSQSDVSALEKGYQYCRFVAFAILAATIFMNLT